MITYESVTNRTKLPKETLQKLCKEYVLDSIKEFCDIDWFWQIESIYFWDLEYWMDFVINYKSWNSDGYSYEKNVLPKIKLYTSKC